MLEHLELALFWMASAAYTIAWLLYLVGWKKSSGQNLRVGTFILLLGIIFHTGLVGLRWYRADHVPFLSAFEFVTFFAFLVALVFLMFARHEKNRALGVFLLPVVFLLMLALISSASSSRPLAVVATSRRSRRRIP